MPRSVVLLIVLAACGAPASEPAAPPPPSTPTPTARSEEIVRIDAHVESTLPVHDGPMPTRCARVVVFRRDGVLLAGRDDVTCTVEAAEASAAPVPADDARHMVEVIAGVEFLPVVSPYAGCPELVVETTTRRFEATACADRPDLADPRSGAPSHDRAEAAERLRSLLPPPPAPDPVLGFPAPALK